MTRRRLPPSAIVVGALLAAAVVGGCGSDDGNPPDASAARDRRCPGDDGRTATTGTATTIAPATGTPPTTGAEPPEGSATTVYERGDIDEGLRPFIDQATEDLATRLAIDTGDIEALSAVLVTWPDASLGCPQPGMQYAQVLTDGSIIELGVGEGDDLVVYRYHSGGSKAPFLCDQPLDRKPAAGG